MHRLHCGKYSVLMQYISCFKKYVNILLYYIDTHKYQYCCWIFPKVIDLQHLSKQK